MKKCLQCEKTKELKCFYTDQRGRMGVRSYCKECDKIRARKVYYTSMGRTVRKIAKPNIVPKKHIRKAANMNQRNKKNGFDERIRSYEYSQWETSTPQTCHYCGQTLGEYQFVMDFIRNYRGDNHGIIKYRRFFGNRRQTDHGLTIDRANNGIGYTTNNMRRACWFCNCLKGDILEEFDMKELAPRIISRLRKEISTEIMWLQRGFYKCPANF